MMRLVSVSNPAGISGNAPVKTAGRAILSAPAAPKFSSSAAMAPAIASLGLIGLATLPVVLPYQLVKRAILPPQLGLSYRKLKTEDEKIAFLTTYLTEKRFSGKASGASIVWASGHLAELSNDTKKIELILLALKNSGNAWVGEKGALKKLVKAAKTVKHPEYGPALIEVAETKQANRKRPHMSPYNALSENLGYAIKADAAMAAFAGSQENSGPFEYLQSILKKDSDSNSSLGSSAILWSLNRIPLVSATDKEKAQLILLLRPLSYQMAYHRDDFWKGLNEAAARLTDPEIAPRVQALVQETQTAKDSFNYFQTSKDIDAKGKALLAELRGDKAAVAEATPIDEADTISPS